MLTLDHRPVRYIQMAKKKQASRAKSFVRPTIPKEELAQLPALLKQQCGWEIKEFQHEALLALAAGKDVIAHAATGSGKTALFTALHLLPSLKGMVTICTSPLIALQNEQVCATLSVVVQALMSSLG